MNSLPKLTDCTAWQKPHVLEEGWLNHCSQAEAAVLTQPAPSCFSLALLGWAGSHERGQQSRRAAPSSAGFCRSGGLCEALHDLEQEHKDEVCEFKDKRVTIPNAVRKRRIFASSDVKSSPDARSTSTSRESSRTGQKTSVTNASASHAPCNPIPSPRLSLPRGPQDIFFPFTTSKFFREDLP